MNREECDRISARFRHVVAVQFLGTMSGGQKLIIIEREILYSGLTEQRWNLRLPDPFGKPDSPGSHSKMFLDIFTEPVYLFNGICPGNDRQNCFVHRTAEQFHLIILNQAVDQIKVLAAVLFKPFKQTA